MSRAPYYFETDVPEFNIEAHDAAHEGERARPFVGCYATKGANQAITTGTWTTLTLGMIWDTGPDSAGTGTLLFVDANDYVKIPQGYDGYWQFTIQATWDNTGVASKRRGCRLYKNNATAIATKTDQYTASVQTASGFTFVAKLVAGDTVEFQAWHNDGVNATVLSGDDLTYIQAVYLGP